MDVFDACYAFHDADLVKAEGLYPYFRPISASEGPIAVVEGRQVIMMGSNDYLGLTHHPEVMQAAHDAIDRYGTGCTGSRFLNGNLDLHEALERELAEFTGKEAALVFSSGFLANLGVVGLLGSAKDAVLFSEIDNHASLMDGAKMARSRRLRVFKGVGDLERQLRAQEEWTNALVVVDGVFSMTGRVADLRGIVDLKKRYKFRLYVDDAHGFGVLGPGGRGTAAAQGVSDEVDVLFGTFSKALASLGGFVASDRSVIDYLRHRTRTQIFSAGLPPSSSAAALTSLRVLRRDSAILEHLWNNVAYFREGVQRLGYHTMGSTTPIVPLFVGSETQAFLICREAEELGLFVTPAVYPAVPFGHALIRTSVTPAHTRQHLDTALQVLGTLAERHPIPDVDPETIPPAREMDFEAAMRAKAAAAAP